jgi:hypothetical protein
MNKDVPRFSRGNIINSFFTGTRPVALPQGDNRLYKYNLNDWVRVDLNKGQRKWPYKFSLQTGTSYYLQQII